MLAWLRERVAAVPDGLHGVIVPDLDAHRGTLERALAAALQPDLELPGADRQDRVFDLAGGHPLIAQPVVEAALAALGCAAGSIDWATGSRLLLSPHLAGAGVERSERIAPTSHCASGRAPRACAVPGSRRWQCVQVPCSSRHPWSRYRGAHGTAPAHCCVVGSGVREGACRLGLAG